MATPSRFGEDSPSVQSHIALMQGVIGRMASNSSSCKAWCVGLVSAILVVVAEKRGTGYAVLATLPTLLFWFLDAYYLGLEKQFRDQYNEFIKKLHEGRLEAGDLFAVAPTGSSGGGLLHGLSSTSVSVFYASLLALTWIATWTLKLGSPVR